MARQVPATDVMLTLVASPHRDDTVTHVLRTVVALLENGRKVGVWACGYATTLTSGGLGASKPRDLASWDTDYPSTATIVAALLEAYDGSLYWYACRFCSDDRGVERHIDGVVSRAPSRFRNHVAASAKCLIVGGL